MDLSRLLNIVIYLDYINIMDRATVIPHVK